MELMLWRWSTTVQLSSLAIIAVFFAVLSRSVRSAELRWWVLAWCANFVALGITLGYWYLQPPDWSFPFVRSFYMSAKTAFVLFLMEGAWSLKRPGRGLFRARYLIPGFAGFSLLSALAISTINQVGIVQHFTMGLLLAIGFGLIWKRPRDPGLAWLAPGEGTVAGRAILIEN